MRMKKGILFKKKQKRKKTAEKRILCKFALSLTYQPSTGKVKKLSAAETVNWALIHTRVVPKNIKTGIRSFFA